MIDETYNVNHCMKTQQVVPHAGTKHTNYKTAGLPHAKKRPRPPVQKLADKRQCQRGICRENDEI